MEIMNNPKQDLPNATTILVLGILSLVFCWCYGIIGLILGIITVVMANGQRKNYLASPDVYTESSYKNVNSGRICGIIAICIASFIFVFWILILMGVMAIGLGALSCGL